MIKIAIDAGHGNATPGKRTPDGVSEWKLNSDIAKKITNLLSNYDVEVIRLDDPTGKTDKALLDRINQAIANNVKFCVSIHHNAEPSVSGKKYGTATGVEIYVRSNSNPTTKKLAKQIIDKFATKSGMKNRGVKVANYVMTRVCTFPTMLIEGGFMNAKPDRDKLETSAYQNAYAESVVEVIVEHLKLKKKSTEKVPTKNTNKKEYYTSCNLNLREDGNSSAKHIVTIPINTKVSVLDKSTNWYKVSVTLKGKKYTGHAYGAYINEK